MDDVEYVRNSRYRMDVVRCLKGRLSIPSEIAEDAGIFNNHISNTLRQLREHGLVECVNPEAKRGRLYRLTDKGKRVCDNIDA